MHYYYYHLYSVCYIAIILESWSIHCDFFLGRRSGHCVLWHASTQILDLGESMIL